MLTYSQAAGQYDFPIVESSDPFGAYGEKGSGYMRLVIACKITKFSLYLFIYFLKNIID